MLTTRTMIFLSAAAAAGIVFLTQPSHSEQTVGMERVKIQDRHPAFNVGSAMRDSLGSEREKTPAPSPDFAPKSDKLDVAANCEAYTWPRIPAVCLDLAGDTASAARPRLVTVRADAGDRISFVTPAATIVAQR